MNIRPIEASERNTYECLAMQYGTVFNSLAWLDMFGSNVRLYGIFDKGERLIGGFHLYREKKFGLTIYREPPLTATMGPFLKIDAKNPVAVMDTWKKVLTCMADFIDGLRYAVVSLSLDKTVIDTQPFIWKKFKVTPGYTYVLDLNKSLDDIQKAMSAERRNDITKATRDGLTAVKVDHYQDVGALTSMTYGRQEKEYDRLLMDQIIYGFANRDNSFAFITYKGSQPVSASFCIYDQTTAYYLFGGYDHENRHHGAGALSLWTALGYAKGLGLKYFDFEGSMVPDIERHFRGYGGTLTPYYRVNKALLPLEMILKLFKREFF